METYNVLLTERFAVIQDIQHLSQQNAELKQVLRQYMSAKINEELCIPPTKVLMGQRKSAKKLPTSSM
jgi:dynein regulatory complex protein 1